jgi:UDP-N-acetylglucosamine 4,6-dehydratase
MSLASKTILITGGTGTFGQAFTQYALDHGAREVRVFSRDELKQSEMESRISDKRVKYICGDIRDSQRITDACQGVDTVIHAAAMKRLETCEREPQEAVKTNVMGSINVINACFVQGVSQAIALSSDKAVYPANTYGKTKALMESVWIQSNLGFRSGHHETRFSIVRYGNVLGSRGSVVDIFREQARKGSMQVTNADMTRFFMSVNRATKLVDLAIETQHGGEIYLPFLKATSIGNLANVLGNGTPFVSTRPRSGEKVHEDIITEKEITRAYLCKTAVVVEPEYLWGSRYTTKLDPSDFPMKSCDADKLTHDEIIALIREADATRGVL